MPTMRNDAMRGFAVFITDIRNCKSKEAEVKRVNKELANIRNKFGCDKPLDGYQKKKYVCKLLFIFLLGHDIDFGHMEAINLLSSNRFSEKQMGYLFISVLVNTNSELIKLIIQSIKNDLKSSNPVHINMAIHCIANIGGLEMAEAFGQDVPKILASGHSTDSVKQSAALCLLGLFRTSPDIIHPGEWTQRLLNLLNDQHLGVVTAVASLVDALVKNKPEEYKECVQIAVFRLSKLITTNYIDLDDYTYYFVPAPWLSVKLLRLLQNYTPIPDNLTLNECLLTILNKSPEPPKSKKVQHSNAKNAVLFEAINLIFQNDQQDLILKACNQLGVFLSSRETNLRYLALESMCHLASSKLSHESIKKHQQLVINSMKLEKDLSVRQQAVDLLYAMCDKTNAEEIIQKMLEYLETSAYSIREEMVLKVAILAEKYAIDYTWYVDVILNLIRIAGDYVSEEVWFRVIQIVVNRVEVQGYAAKTVFEALQAPSCHENMVKVGGYILGEFGNLIAGDQRSSPLIQFRLLHSKYHLCSTMTRSLLLSTYIKFVNLFPEVRFRVQEVFQTHSNLRSGDAELQQRSSEYLQLSIRASSDVLATVLEEMPVFPERESSILSVLNKKKQPGHKSQASKQLKYTAELTTGPFGDMPKSKISKNVQGILLNISGDTVNSRFVFKNNGVLFENDLIQIGVKSEFCRNLGRVKLFHGNKTSVPFTNFAPEISKECPNLKIQIKTMESILKSGTQIQQPLNIECCNEYKEPPNLLLTFCCNGTPYRIITILPLTINKFLEPVEMNGESFFVRWRKLGEMASQKIFKAVLPMDFGMVRMKILDFGMNLLEGVDPNPENFVGAGILHMSQQVGCMLRLEPHKEAKMYRLTVRASKKSVSAQICDLLADQF